MAVARVLLTGTAVLMSALLLACSATEDSPATGSTAPPDTTGSTTERPVLSTALTHDCPRDPSSAGPDRAGLDAGQTAVDFTLKDVDGREFSLSTLLAERPVVMVFGSFT